MLRIIADDLGLTKSVNDGIIFLLKNRKVSGASLMANGEAFEDAVFKCTEVGPLNIGAHLVLVEENSVSGMKFPKNHRTFFIKYVLGLIKLPDIEREFSGQLDKITRAGIKPVFINSHQHLHLLPGIMDITISLAKIYRIPYIRIVKEPLGSKGSLFRKAQLIFLKFLSLMAKNKIKRAGLKCNDFFVGFINAGNLGLNDLNLVKKLQNKSPDKLIELGCHPGFENAELADKYRHWRYNWRKELEILRK